MPSSTSGGGSGYAQLLCVVVTALLVAPAFLYDTSHYVTSTGQAGMLVELPVLFGAIVVAACAAALWLARDRYGWLAGAVAVVLATPRFFVYDVTYLLVGVPASDSDGEERMTR